MKPSPQNAALGRAALFGGSFNPVHLGHLLVAHAACDELDLERVCFIPAAQSPFKAPQETAPAAVRLRLLRLALAGEPRFALDTREVERGGISYTIDTVREHLKTGSPSELFYLIGADIVPQLPAWREAAELAGLVTFIAIPRPGETSLRVPPGFRCIWLKGTPLALSASEVRDRIRRGKSIRWLVPPLVEEAILNNRLYL